MRHFVIGFLLLALPAAFVTGYRIGKRDGEFDRTFLDQNRPLVLDFGIAP